MSDYQKEISEKYGTYTWSKKKLKDDCKNPKFELHNTQKFLTKYFSPDYLGASPKEVAKMDKLNLIKPRNIQKGMILYHSVGSGKTCAAISIAANFDVRDYNVLWVTRNSLKNVMYQNIFDQICHPRLEKDKIGKTDRQRMGYFNKVTNKRWFKPISYRTFSNLFRKKSKFYRELVAKNGKNDILKNTLVIVDEAHNFTSPKPKGMSKLERPNVTHIQSLINNSYKKSGENSVRLLLLTATPSLNGIIGLTNMLNLLIPDEKDKLPVEPKKFVKKFLTKDMSKFTKSGEKTFKNTTKKYVSFLDRTKDYNIFAKKDLKDEIVKLSQLQVDTIQKCEKTNNKKYSCMQRATIWNERASNVFRFEHPSFEPKLVKSKTNEVATKFDGLLKKIDNLDKADMKKEKKTYKHVIFVNEPKYVKFLTSVMKAHGFEFVYEPTTRQRGKNMVNTLKIKEKLSKKGKNFGIFTKGTIYKRAVPQKMVARVNKMFNKRPENIHGKNLRFIIIDKNYLEGVSFFDVKYFHILTKPFSTFEMKQLIGRVIRTCGHKGLPFKKNKGWLINIFIYRSHKDKKDYDKAIEDAKKESMNKDELMKMKIENVVVKEIEDNAFDKLLTKPIH